jgi:hypothetical protein
VEEERDMDEDIDWDQVGEMEDDPDSEDDTPRDPVMEAVFAVVDEGEEEAIALIDGVEANVAERERLWLWLKVEDPDPDRVAIEDAVMNLLADMETEDEEETLDDTSVDGETLELELDEVVADRVVL